MADMFQPTTPATDESVSPVVGKPAPRVLSLALDPAWSAGRKLAEARTQQGFSLEQMADRTKVRALYLEAIEAMDAKLLPGRAYTIAYIRSYAKALGLNTEEILAQYQAENALSREDPRPQIRGPESRPDQERPWLAAAVLGFVAAGFVMWRAFTPGQGEVLARDPSMEFAQDGSATIAASPEAVALRTLEIRAQVEAKLEVRGADGTVFFYGTLRPGQSYRPDPAPDWTIHARDGGAFSLVIQGQEVGLLGEAGKPVLGRLVSTIPLPPPLGQVATGPSSATP
jgi:transcriptional regulator with XRE-family HTH domain